MSNYKETLSAFVDDAARSDELEQLAIQNDDRSAGLVARYQMIGEALRGDLNHAVFVDVAQQVRDELAKDTQTSHARPARSVVQSLFDFSSWSRPTIGMAMAASAALVVVVTVAQFESADGQLPGIVADQTAPANITPVTTLAAQPVSPHSVPVNLNNYLEKHAVFASQDTVMRRMPYARAVSYESK